MYILVNKNLKSEIFFAVYRFSAIKIQIFQTKRCCGNFYFFAHIFFGQLFSDEEKQFSFGKLKGDLQQKCLCNCLKCHQPHEKIRRKKQLFGQIPFYKCLKGKQS